MSVRRVVICGFSWLATACLWAGPAGSPIDLSEAEARLGAVRGYRYGATRAPLLEFERFVQAHVGDPAAVGQIERRLIGLAKSDSPVEVRAFACEQLGVIGGAASADALEGLLNDPALSFHAMQALQRIPDPAAGRVLKEGLERSDGAMREAIRQALIARGDIKPPAPATATVRRPVPPRAPSSTIEELLKRLRVAEAGTLETVAAEIERLPDAAADDAILTAATHAAPPARARLITALAARGAKSCAPTLLQWAENDPNEIVRVAAIEALGKIGGSADLKRLAAIFTAAKSPSDERSAQGALWALYRRTAKPAELRKAVAESIGAATPQRRDVLEKMLVRATELERSPGPTADTLAAEPGPTGEGDPIFPDGHRLVIYSDCGMDDISGGGGGPVMRLAQGKGHKFGGRDPVRSVVTDPKEVRFEIGGLRDDSTYVFGLTWWDADGQGRKQSVHLGSGDPIAWRSVLPPAAAMAFHAETSVWARVQFPLPSGTVRDGRFQAAIRCEAGPNAVVSEAWVLERLPGAGRKRVLIVCGDDHRAHRWRETGPTFAAMLREDPRLEVSITESPAILGSALLPHYDAVMLHFKNYPQRLPLGPEIWQGLEKFALSGKGIILAHFGCGAFEEWDNFQSVAGRIWDKAKRGHDPYGPFRVMIKDATHPITQGMEDFETADELYTCLKGEAAIRVLCAATSKIDNLEHPMAFVGDAEKIRLFHCTLGHDMASLGHEGTRKLYRRAVAWACGLQ